MIEIGSEFMENSYKTGINKYVSLVPFPKRYVLSGRTGLHLVAEELLHRSISSIALPAYCCGAMVAPFYNAGVEIEFYDNPVVPKSDAVLIMDYFGFIFDSSLSFANKCRTVGKTIVIDATQTAFSKSEIYNNADFVIVSYRKWFDCLCAAVYSKNGFSVNEYHKNATRYIEAWREAARQKRKYLVTEKGNKPLFLSLYSQANAILAKDYIGYRASQSEIERFENVDSDFIRIKRRKNAQVLIKALSKKTNLLFEEMKTEDCPLHIPVLIPEKERLWIRERLTENGIYCPCHWPIDKNYPYKKTIYHQEELSLICDQRYSEDEIAIEANTLIDILENEKR